MNLLSSSCSPEAKGCSGIQESFTICSTTGVWSFCSTAHRVLSGNVFCLSEWLFYPFSLSSISSFHISHLMLVRVPSASHPETHKQPSPWFSGLGSKGIVLSSRDNSSILNLEASPLSFRYFVSSCIHPLAFLSPQLFLLASFPTDYEHAQAQNTHSSPKGRKHKRSCSEACVKLVLSSRSSSWQENPAYLTPSPSLLSWLSLALTSQAPQEPGQQPCPSYHSGWQIFNPFFTSSLSRIWKCDAPTV